MWLFLTHGPLPLGATHPPDPENRRIESSGASRLDYDSVAPTGIGRFLSCPAIHRHTRCLASTTESCRDEKGRWPEFRVSFYR